MNPSEEPQADFYEILELDESATLEEVKRAYRRLVRKAHPDANLNAQTAALFRQVQEAYETLRDPAARAEYDARMEAQRRSAPFTLEVTLSQALLPCRQEPQMLYVLAEVSAREEAKAPRQSLNLCLLMDKSNSMAGERIEQAIAAALSILAQLSPEDTVSIVAFSDRAEVLVPPQSGGDPTLPAGRLRSLVPGGGTEIGEGLAAALGLLARAWSPGAFSHLFLLTDGYTYGDEARCLRLAEEAHRQGVGISTLGIGTAWNEDLLDQIALRSGGLSFYVERPSEIGAVLTEHVRWLSSLVCPHLEARCFLEPEVSLAGAFLITPQTARLAPEGADASLRLGGLSFHAPTSFLLECLVSPCPPSPRRMGTLQVKGTFAEGQGGSPLVVRVPVRVTFQDPPLSPSLVPPKVVWAARKANLLKLEEQARRDVDRGWHEHASQRLRALATQMLDMGAPELARTTLLEADQVAVTGKMTPEGQKRVHYGTRMLRALPPGGGRP
ncbi:MAG: DnaJ domain-containing protein [Anaerolineae bacterium]